MSPPHFSLDGPLRAKFPLIRRPISARQLIQPLCDGFPHFDARQIARQYQGTDPLCYE
jgi:hypothetical protein